MKLSLELPLSVLDLLYNSEEYSKVKGDTDNRQYAQSELITDIMKKFINKYEIYNRESPKKPVWIKTSYIENYINHNRGRGQHCFDSFISMAIEDILGDKRNNVLPEETEHDKYLDVFYIPIFLTNDKDKNELSNELYSAVKNFLETTNTFTVRETKRTVKYEVNDAFYYYLFDLSGYSGKFVDNTVSFVYNRFKKLQKI